MTCCMSDAWFQVEVALKPMPLPMSQLQGLRVDVSKSLSIRTDWKVWFG